MGQRFYQKQREYLRRIGALKEVTTTQINKQIHIDFLESVFGLEGELESLNRVSLYGLEKLRISVEQHILHGS